MAITKPPTIVMVDPLKSLGPRHALMTINPRRLISLQALPLGVAFAALSGSNKDTPLAVGGQNTILPRQICAWL
jgi:hypothetical protein